MKLVILGFHGCDQIVIFCFSLCMCVVVFSSIISVMSCDEILCSLIGYDTDICLTNSFRLITAQV